MSDPIDQQDGNTGAVKGDQDFNKVTGDLILHGTIEIPVANTNTAERNADESSKHRKRSCFDIFAYIVIPVFVGAALVGVGALQYTVYNRQAKIMEADHRPWLAIAQNADGHLQATAPLVFDGTKWKTTLRYGVANVSKTPAFNVSMNVAPYVHSNVVGAIDALTKLCNEVKNPPMLGAPNNAYGTGTVIFPENEILISDIPLEFTKTEVDAAKKADGFFNVFVEVCAAYQAPDAPGKHASGASYLALIRDPQGSGVKSFSIITEQPIDTGLIVFAPGLPTYGD